VSHIDQSQGNGLRRVFGDTMKVQGCLWANCVEDQCNCP
jgi:hypothetical protein